MKAMKSKLKDYEYIELVHELTNYIYHSDRNSVTWGYGQIQYAVGEIILKYLGRE